MIPELYIVGAGGFGRELYCWLKDLAGWGRDWTFAGFLDDNLAALDEFKYDGQVVAPAHDYVPRAGQVFACGIGNVAIKEKVCGPLLARGANFLTVVHPRAVVGANVELGAGAVICPGVVLTCDIKVGEMAMLNLHSSIGHDVSIGKWTTLSPQSNLNGGVTVGASVFLGSGAVILPGHSVGDSALVGAGSVVMRDVKRGQSVFGNPARVFNQAAL